MATANVNRGIDLNRNYLPFWGGPGSSTSATASNTRGEAPGLRARDPRHDRPAINSNPVDGRRSTTTRPTSACCARRAPPTSPTSSYDQAAYQGLLERLATNLPGWPAGPWTDVYYEASSTAEQQAYYGYGAFGFTPEATPGFSGNADVPPALPERDRQLPRHRHALRRTRRCAGSTTTRSRPRPSRALHSVITGTAPAGATLTLTKTYTLDTSQHGLDDRPAGAGPRVPERDPDDAHACPRTGSSSGT